MSDGKFEVLHQMAHAINRRDADAFVAHCTEDVEWEENTPVYPGLRRRYRGLVELREYFDEAFIEFWEEFHAKIIELREAPGEAVLVEGLLIGRGRASGVETRLRVWQVIWFVEAKVSHRQLFLDRNAALEAAGLSESG